MVVLLTRPPIAHGPKLASVVTEIVLDPLVTLKPAHLSSPYLPLFVLNQPRCSSLSS